MEFTHPELKESWATAFALMKAVAYLSLTNKSAHKLCVKCAAPIRLQENPSKTKFAFQSVKRGLDPCINIAPDAIVH